MANIYDIDYKSSNKNFIGKELKDIDELFETNKVSKSSYAYIIDSQDYNIPAIMNNLLESKVYAVSYTHLRAHETV